MLFIKTTDKYIEIMDPADGEVHKIPHDEFKKQWTGVLVLIAPGEKFSVKNEKISVAVPVLEFDKAKQGDSFSVTYWSTCIFRTWSGNLNLCRKAG